MNWTLLDQENQNNIWDKFYQQFNFKPNISPKDLPSIGTSLPYLKLDIAGCFSLDYPKENFSRMEKLAETLFMHITDKGEQMYALDWQHEAYVFDPSEEMDRNELYDEWLIPIFPNGDYYIFLTKDFKNVWFGHPWERTITLIGDKMVKAGTQLIFEFDQIGIRLYPDR